MAFTKTSDCKKCKKYFVYTAEYPNGAKRKLCDKCKKKHEKAMNKGRVAKHRMANSDRGFAMTQHIGSAQLGRTYCGLSIDHMVPENVIQKLPGEKVRMCAKCESIKAALIAGVSRAE